MSRKTNRGNRSRNLTIEERQAVMKFQRDAQKAMPKIVETAQAAQRVFAEMRDAPVWKLAETPRPQGVSEPKLWTVGHAKVNYVDHIELKTEGAQEK
jgi:hypothetical protein